MVYEIDKGLEVSELDSPEIDERVVVWQPPEDVPEECGAGREDDPVDLDLLRVITSQSQVEEVSVVSQIPKCGAEIRLKLVPSKTKFLSVLHCHCHCHCQEHTKNLCGCQSRWRQVDDVELSWSLDTSREQC